VAKWPHAWWWLIASVDGACWVLTAPFPQLKRWRDGQMALRWRARGMLEAGHQFRRVNGHLHLPKLPALPEAQFTENADSGYHHKP
jgi:hypothetical protein